MENPDSRAPVSAVVIEMGRFDFAKMENPGIRNWEYQKGRLSGFKDVNEAVSARQHGKCLLCGKPIQHYHHMIPRSGNGSNSIDNIAGLCLSCHEKVHTSVKTKEQLERKQTGLLKKYHALSVIGQIMPALLDELACTIDTYVTTGYETARIREEYGLPEKHKDDGTHYIDAWCIAVSAMKEKPISGPYFDGNYYTIQQYRRHDRAIVKAQKERTYYPGKQAVARNRHARTGQADGPNPLPSLAQYRAKHPENVSRLTVKKSLRSYNDPKRIMPGAKIEYQDNLYVLQGNHNTRYILQGVSGNGVARSKCHLIRRNAGLVFNSIS